MTADCQAAAYEALSDAESAQKSLLRRFDALAALIPAEVASANGVQALLEGVKEDISAQSYATGFMIRYIPREFRKPAAAAALAQKVFGAPELLEKILCLVDPRTAFEANRVNKDFFHTIEGSRILQRHIGLQADGEADFTSTVGFLVSCESGACVENPVGQLKDMDMKIEMPFQLVIRPHLDSGSLSIAGARLRKVFLTQPPIRELVVRATCCQGSYYGGPTSRILNDAGITIGEMWDQVTQLSQARRLCPHASVDLHDDDGFVRPTVVFSGTIPLREDDALVVKDTEDGAEADERERRTRAFRHRMYDYIQAKEAADRNFLPIPTLAAFEAEKERRMGLEKGRNDNDDHYYDY